MQLKLGHGLLLITGACVDRGEPVVTTDDPGTGTTAEPTTDEPTTGPAIDPCDPGLPPIPEAEFAERYAATICQQKSDCGCEVDFNCALEFVDGFELIRKDGANLSLTYDGACAARKLAGLVQSRGCLDASAIDLAPSCSLNCLVYRGDVLDGGACTSPPVLLTSLFADKCADPDHCAQDVCTPPLKMVADGQPCLSPLANCGASSACDYAGSKLCEPLRGAGESCTGNGVCRGELYCAGDGTCTARGAAGAACADDEQCASRRCSDSQCEDWVWICEVREEVDIFGRHPGDF